MHEFGIVHQLVSKFCKQDSCPEKIGRVKLRFGPGLDRSCLAQAFQIETIGTPLAGARLELEPLKNEIACKCGKMLSVAHEHEGKEHDHGLPYLECSCGAVVPIPQFDTLELTLPGAKV